MTTPPNTDPLGNIPRYVIFRNKRSRVIGYENGRFLILGPGDQTFQVTRDRITFLPEKKTK